MSLTTSIAVQPTPAHAQTSFNYTETASALAALFVAMYVAKKSKKQLKKLKRKLFFSMAKETLKAKIRNFKNLFSKKPAASDRTLLYIIIGAVVLALIIIEPIVGLAVLLLALLILLLVNNGHLTAGK